MIVTLNVNTGIISRPQKVVIYGAEGIGKTTLAASFPDPLFIDTEDSTSHIDVRRTDRPKTWDDLLYMIGEVGVSPGICKTLVIDTVDRAEQLAVAYVCAKFKKAGIEEFGYSKGYTYLSEEFTKLLAGLDQVIDAGMHVVVTAHAKMRKFEQPDELGSYDRWETKLAKNDSPLLKEWCDLLLFCNYKTYIVQSSNAMEKTKVQGGKRVMYATHHACWDAKNRHGLPDEMPLDYKSISHIFEKEPEKKPKNQSVAPKEPEKKPNNQTEAQKKPESKGLKRVTPVEPDSPLVKLLGMMADANVKESELQKVVSDRGQYSIDTPISEYPDKFINNWIFKHWDKVLEMINKNKEEK